MTHHPGVADTLMPANNNVDGFTADANTALIVTIIAIMFYVVGNGIALYSVKSASNQHISLTMKDAQNVDGTMARWQVEIEPKVYQGKYTKWIPTGWAGDHMMYGDDGAMIMAPLLGEGDVRRRVGVAATKLDF